MLSLQNFTKNSSHGWCNLFLISMLEEVLWQVLLIDTVKSSGFWIFKSKPQRGFWQWSWRPVSVVLSLRRPERPSPRGKETFAFPCLLGEASGLHKLTITELPHFHQKNNYYHSLPTSINGGWTNFVFTLLTDFH